MIQFLKRDITPYVLILFLILIIISFIITYGKPLTYTLETGKNNTVDKPINVDIEIEKQMARYSPEEFDIEVTHKYNADESYSFELKPYEVGEYEFIFTPKYSGEYLVKMTLTDEGNTQYFTEYITVKQ